MFWLFACHPASGEWRLPRKRRRRTSSNHQRDTKSHPRTAADAMLRWTLALSCLVATASGFGVSLQQRRPLLPAQRRPYAPVSLVRMQADLAAAVPDEPAPPVGLKARVAAMLPPKKEMQKLVRRRHRPPNYPPRACVPRNAPLRSSPTVTVTGGRYLWPPCSSASSSRTRSCATPRTCWCAPPPAQRQPSTAPERRRPASQTTSPPVQSPRRPSRPILG